MVTKAEHTPELDKASFDCPRCGAYTSHTWHDLLSEESGSFRLAYDSMEDVGGMFITPVSWKMITCFVCGNSSVWRRDRLIFPTLSTMPTPSEDMPAAARGLYDEARAVFGPSRRASAALIRAAMESLLRELDKDAPRGSRLDDLIGRLEGKVSFATWQLLTTIRHLGNGVLHGSADEDEVVALYLGDIDPGAVELLFTAVNDVLDELIAKPRAAEAIYKLVPKGVRDTAEKKAKAAVPGEVAPAE